jgi:prephenate dehydrogenase
MNTLPRVGIVGIAGAYGRWLERFFGERMGLPVSGCDPALRQGPSPQEVRDRSEILVFAVPIRHSASIIRALTAEMPRRPIAPLWIDVTSIKQAPVEAMLAAPVEVLGLHPMAAPPQSPTLKGRVLVVCEGRLDHWREFSARLLAMLEAQCVRCSPSEHDAIMARVQALAHAAALALAGVLADDAGRPSQLFPYRTPIYELAHAVMARILSSNPAIYEDIQFGSAAVAPLLQRLAARTQELAGLVQRGDDQAREAFRTRFLAGPQGAFGSTALEDGNAGFERLALLLADLAEPRCLTIHLPEDRPGALRGVLAEFEAAGISIESIHSSRSPDGEVQFRIGFSREQHDERIRAATARTAEKGLARVIALLL